MNDKELSSLLGIVSDQYKSVALKNRRERLLGVFDEVLKVYHTADLPRDLDAPSLLLAITRLIGLSSMRLQSKSILTSESTRHEYRQALFMAAALAMVLINDDELFAHTIHDGVEAIDNHSRLTVFQWTTTMLSGLERVYREQEAEGQISGILNIGRGAINAIEVYDAIYEVMPLSK